MKIFSCLCNCETLFLMTIDEIHELISDGSLSVDFIIIETKSEIHISCRESIVFCSDFYKDHETCGNVLEPISCFDLIPFSFNNICGTCLEILSEHFFYNLVRIKDG